MRRKRFQLAERRFKVARLYSQGKKQFEIAQELKISEVTVLKDLDIVVGDWKIFAARNIDMIKAEKLMEIAELKRTNYEGYYRSIAEKKKKIERKETGQRDGKGVSITTKANETSELTGDPRYLQDVQWCIDKEIELLAIEDLAAGGKEFILTIEPASKKLAQRMARDDSEPSPDGD